MAKMMSAVVTAPRTVALKQLPLCALAPTGVRIRLRGCGVCASNLPVWEGRDWFRYPLAPGAPGHEGWGVVEDVGSAVGQVRAGDPVAVLSQHAFAEYDVSDESQVVRLPPSLAEQPFPGEPLGCAMNVFRRSDIKPGHKVAVVGIGFMGGLLVQLAREAGATVYALSGRPLGLRIAERMGATEVISLRDTDGAVHAVRELTQGQGCERVIEATGHQEPLDVAGELCRERGRLVIAGYHQDGLRQINLQSWNWRGLDVINAHERDPAVYMEGIRAAVNAVEEQRLDPHPLYTHRYPLGRLGEALEVLSARPSDLVKILVQYG